MEGLGVLLQCFATASHCYVAIPNHCSYAAYSRMLWIVPEGVNLVFPALPPTQLTINVSDFNDNPPKFPLPAYTVSINETSPPNTMVITVMAVDPDFGTNSVVDYSLTGSSE